MYLLHYYYTFTRDVSPKLSKAILVANDNLAQNYANLGKGKPIRMYL